MAFYPTITLEEHWLSKHVRDFYLAKGAHDPNDEDGLVGVMTPALEEFGAKRLESMDEGNVAIQVVSHVGNTIALDLDTCVKVNDELHGLIKSHPGRFAGFATLPMADPAAASRELERCVKDLGFVGTLVDNTVQNRFYDDEFFWPVFQMAESLDVPFYLHPVPNEQTRPLLYNGNYPDSVSESMSEYGWGWHSETAIHFLRLYAAGLFERFPKIKLVLGHMGEMLPFQLDRVNRIASRQWPALGAKVKRTLREVWDENVWITTSGMFSLAPMATVVRQCKRDRVLLSVDYPFSSNKMGLDFLKAVKDDGMIDDDFLERIAYKNAEELLKIKVRKN